MALKHLPRRLQHGEEATLVEHLGELRTRILISLFAIVPAFIVAFIFRDTLIDVLTRPLPDDKKLITLGVTEPFTTAVKVSLAAAFAVTLPLLLYQLWAFLAPALEEGKQRTVAVFATFATILFACGVAFSYFIVLPRALSFLTSFGEEFFQVEIRASYYFSFVTLTLLASGLAFQMPIFILALVRLRILTADRLRRNRRIGIALMIVFAVLLPTVDPVSLVLEAAPLIILFELSIQLAGSWRSAGTSPTRNPAGRPSEDPLRRLGAAVEGEPIENGAVAIEDGVIAAVGTARELGEGERFPDSAIVPGFVNAHTHLEYAVYAGFGDGLSFGPWISTHVERKRRLDRAGHGGDRAPRRRRVPPFRDHDGRRPRVHGRERARVRRARAARDRLPRGLRQGRRRARCGSSRRSAPTSPRRSRSASASASRRTPPTPARARSTPRPWGSACRWRPISTRARTSSTGCCAAKAPGSRWRRCWSSRRA